MIRIAPDVAASVAIQVSNLVASCGLAKTNYIITLQRIAPVIAVLRRTSGRFQEAEWAQVAV